VFAFYFKCENVIKGFIKSSWLGFSTLLYIYQETCKLLVWLITVPGSDFQLQPMYAKPQSFNLEHQLLKSLGGMEKNMISETNIEPPLTSLTLFSLLLKFIGSSAVIWASSLIKFDIFFQVGVLGNPKQNGKY